MKEIYEVCSNWDALLEHAKNECVFGDSLDMALFKRCMQDAFVCLMRVKEREAFDRAEMELYGRIYAYSCLPAATESEDAALFEASLYAAGDLAEAWIHPEQYRFEDHKLISQNTYQIDDESIEACYNFESGDMDNYLRLIEEGFLGF